MLNGLKAALAYFATVFLAGFVFGAVRVLVVVPHVGDEFAVLIELPFMLTLSWFACASIAVRFSVPAMIAPRMVMGSVAFVLLMAAEANLSIFAVGRTLAQHLETLLTMASLLGLAGQVAFALFPVIQIARRRSAERPLADAPQ